MNSRTRACRRGGQVISIEFYMESRGPDFCVGMVLSLGVPNIRRSGAFQECGLLRGGGRTGRSVSGRHPAVTYAFSFLRWWEGLLCRLRFHLPG